MNVGAGVIARARWAGWLVAATTALSLGCASPSRPEPASTVTPSSGPSIRATPNPVPFRKGSGEVSIEWNTGSDASGEVRVAAGNAEEQTFTQGPHGAQTATWIQSGATYRFSLYGDGAAPPVASVVVTMEPEPGSEMRGILFVYGAVVTLVVWRLTRAALDRRARKAAASEQPPAGAR